MTFSQIGLLRVSLKKLASDTLTQTTQWSRSRKISIAERHWGDELQLFSPLVLYIPVSLLSVEMSQHFLIKFAIIKSCKK
jgi:hypothetical protein